MAVDTDRRSLGLPVTYKRVKAAVAVSTQHRGLSLVPGGDPGTHQFVIDNGTWYHVDVVAIGQMEPEDDPDGNLVDLEAYLKLRDAEGGRHRRLSYASDRLVAVWTVPVTKAHSKSTYSPTIEFWHSDQPCAPGNGHVVAMSVALKGAWPKAVVFERRIDISVSCRAF